MAGKSFRAGIIGWPVGQSLSPVVNAWWRKAYGVEGSYEHLPCEGGGDEFRKLVEWMRAQGFTGANITKPHKANAAAIADELSETAKLLGVSNTILFKKNHLYADNTDMKGFRRALQPILTERNHRSLALVLGAGGAAPAVCLALHKLGYEKIVVSNRTAAKADALATRFDFVTGTQRWDSFEDLLPAADIVVNTTSLGMKGQPPLTIDLSGSPKDQIVADIIYAPRQTELLKQAESRGLRTLNGLPMLAYQAVPGFNYLTGITPEVTPALLQHLEDRLEGRVAPANIALTGSIGMGKSTVASMFEKLGAAVWNADDAVHRLYARNGGAVDPLAELFPAVIENGAVSREKLSAHLLANPGDYEALEIVVHPLVAKDREAFSAEAAKSGALTCVMDIPLLFEKHLEGSFDAVVVVTAEEEVRRERVMARPGMTEEKYRSIVARQMPEDEKIRHADHVIRTAGPLEDTFQAVREVYYAILEKYVF